MSITIIGTVAFDGIETPKGKHEKLLGGSATYAAMAARISADVQIDIVSIVGRDFTPEYFDYFKKRNIQIEGIRQSQNKTFYWSGFYEKDMNQAVTRETQLNCLTEFDPIIPSSAKNSQIVFFANTDPDLQYKALKQFSNPKLVVLDTMNFWIHNKLSALQKMIRSTDVLIINNQELRDLTQKDSVIEGMKKLMSEGPKVLIVKKGEHGAMMYDGKEFFALPALPIDNVVDPTGAGDSFAGGFVGYLATQSQITQDRLRKAMAIGTIISSFTIQGFGTTRIEKLTLEEMNRELQKLIRLSTVPSANP